MKVPPSLGHCLPFLGVLGASSSSFSSFPFLASLLGYSSLSFPLLLPCYGFSLFSLVSFEGLFHFFFFFLPVFSSASHFIFLFLYSCHLCRSPSPACLSALPEPAAILRLAGFSVARPPAIFAQKVEVAIRPPVRRTAPPEGAARRLNASPIRVPVGLMVCAPPA